MIALGCDISTRKLAFGGVRDDHAASITTHVLALDYTRQGAMRLREARAAAFGVFSGYQAECCTVMVEEPPRGDLMRLACVVAEAAQAAIPGALVWQPGPTVWKKELLGHGHAGKPIAVAFAQGLGYDGNDHDVADALCLAQLAWSRWNDALGEAA